MKTNELRIGNWFKSNIYQQVTIEHLEFLLNDSIKDKSIMQPIPLTEDVLVKLPRWFKDLIDDGYFNYTMTLFCPSILEFHTQQACNFGYYANTDSASCTCK